MLNIPVVEILVVEVDGKPMPRIETQERIREPTTGTFDIDAGISLVLGEQKRVGM